MSPEEKEALVRAEYADLGVTVGYIGNVERWGDERRWCLFTRFREVSGSSVTMDIPGPDFDMEAARRWLDSVRGRQGALIAVAPARPPPTAEVERVDVVAPVAAEPAPPPAGQSAPRDAAGAGGLVVLDLPYKDREAAKRAGARWDTTRRVWFAPNAEARERLRAWEASPEKAEKLLAAGAKRRQEGEGRVTLAIPYKDRDAAKRAGARWDGAVWYAPAGADLDALAAWLPAPEKAKEMEAAATARRVAARPCPVLNQVGVKPETHNGPSFRGTWLERGGEVRFLDREAPRGLWVSNAPERLQRLVLVDRPLDAMSHQQLDPREGALYVAFRDGGEGPYLAEAGSYLTRMVRECGGRPAVVLAFSNSPTGAALKRAAREWFEPLGVKLEPNWPTHGIFWNDALQLRERVYLQARRAERAGQDVDRDRGLER